MTNPNTILEQDGIYDGIGMPWIPPAVYHANTARTSRSRLRLMKQSPAHFHANVPATATPDMIMGDAVHAAMLEPERFLRDYLLEPNFGNHAANPGRQLIKEWRDAHIDGRKLLVPKAKAAHVLEIAQTMREHPNVEPIINGGGLVESSVCWTDPETGEAMRARIDLVNEIAAGTMLYDIKKVQDSSPEGFGRQVVHDLLYLQGAMYCEGYSRATGVETCGITFIAFEESRPHAVGLHELSADYLELGSKLYHTLLDELARCRAADRWPDYAAMGVFTLEPPAYIK